MSNFDNNAVEVAQKFADLATAQFGHEFQGAYGIKVNKSYIKVFTTNPDGEPRSLYCFIDADGQIWKGASWHAPAKNFPRGNVVDIVSSGALPKKWEYGVG